MKSHAFFLAAACVAAASLLDCVGDEPAASTSSDGGGGGGGLTCTTSAQCTTGKCVDGFCCDTACSGQCQACDVSGHEGTCTPVTGKPHHDACNGDSDGTCAGACDGTNVDSCTYPTTTCGSGTQSCAAGVAQIPAVCSNGTCGQPTTQACSLGCFQDGCLGVAQLAVAPQIACALLTDGKVRCWGDNTTGELGFGVADGTRVTTPTEANALSGMNVKMLGATNAAVCAVLADGTVKCWGGNFAGQVGTSTNAGTANPVVTPTTVMDGASPLSGATFISSGTAGRFCAIVTGGGIKCWGDNANGALGSGLPGSTAFSSSPVDVCVPGSTVTPCTKATGATYVVGGDNFTCAVIQGQVACWGNDSQQQLGFVNDGGADHPFPIVVQGIKATSVGAGNGVACAANVDGGATCWGSNDDGRVGVGSSNTGSLPPSAVCSSADCSTLLGGVTGVSTSDESVCALAGGAVKCWGSNSAGQLGDGTSTSLQTYPASTAVASGAVQVACAGSTNFAVVVNGVERNVKCWGDNGQHECGDGDDGGAANTPISPRW